MKSVIIIGASGHAKVVIDVLEKQGLYKIIGLVDNSAKVTLLGYNVIGGDDILSQLIEVNPEVLFIIAIGDNFTRNNIVQKYKQSNLNMKFATAIHPSANIGKEVTIGEGSIIMAGSVINADCKIGCHTIINTNASLDHDSFMEDFASLAPGVTIGGNCHIKKLAAISLGAKIIHNITIGVNTVIGAGSVVVKDCEPNMIYYGVPARKIRMKNKNDKYL